MDVNCQLYAPAASLPGEVSKLMYNRDKGYFPGICQTVCYFLFNRPLKDLHV